MSVSLEKDGLEVTTSTGTVNLPADQAVQAAREAAKTGSRLEISFPGRAGYILVLHGRCGVICWDKIQSTPVDLELIAASIRSGF